MAELEREVASGEPDGHPSRAPATKRRAPGLRNKAARAIWSAVRLVLFRPSPRPFFGWRRFLLRLFGASVGRGAKIYPGAIIWAPWNLTAGDGSVIADGVDCYSVDRIVLGQGAIVSQRAYLCAAGHDFNDPLFPLVTAPIRIEAKAWVAAEAFVGPGVTIGEGAVVGARAVVRRNIPPLQVVSGNPASEIGRRNAKAASWGNP